MVKLVRKNQQGVSLISLMIGIAIALVCVLASLQLYAAHRISTGQMKVGSKHSRQLSSAFVVVEKQLMAAGYGIESAGLSDVVVHNIAGTSTTPATISLYWRFSDGAVVCRGLRETSEEFDGKEYRVLTALESNTDCDETTALTSMPWDIEAGVLGNWPVENELAAYIAANETFFDFEITTKDCAPFRVVDSASHISVSVQAPSVVELNGLTGVPQNGIDICLINTQP